MDPFPSGFRPILGAETTAVNQVNDLLVELDGYVTLTVVLNQQLSITLTTASLWVAFLACDMRIVVLLLPERFLEGEVGRQLLLPSRLYFIAIFIT